MKKNEIKKRYLAIGIIIFVFIIILSSNVNATIIIGKITKNERVKEKILSEEPKYCKSSCLGCIYGQTRFFIDDTSWVTSPLPYVLVDAGIRSVRSNLSGHYQLQGLPIGRTYSVIYSIKGFKSKTIMITLSKENPCVEINIVLEGTKAIFLDICGHNTVLSTHIFHKLITVISFPKNYYY